MDTNHVDPMASLAGFTPTHTEKVEHEGGDPDAPRFTTHLVTREDGWRVVRQSYAQRDVQDYTTKQWSTLPAADYDHAWGVVRPFTKQGDFTWHQQGIISLGAAKVMDPEQWGIVRQDDESDLALVVGLDPHLAFYKTFIKQLVHVNEKDPAKRITLEKHWVEATMKQIHPVIEAHKYNRRETIKGDQIDVMGQGYSFHCIKHEWFDNPNPRIDKRIQRPVCFMFKPDPKKGRQDNAGTLSYDAFAAFPQKKRSFGGRRYS